MKILRTSTLTGKKHEMEINVTPEQYENWANGELIQHAMPHLTPDEREFLMTGITHDEWEAAFGEES